MPKKEEDYGRLLHVVCHKILKEQNSKDVSPKYAEKLSQKDSSDTLDFFRSFMKERTSSRKDTSYSAFQENADGDAAVMQRCLEVYHKSDLDDSSFMEASVKLASHFESCLLKTPQAIGGILVMFDYIKDEHHDRGRSYSWYIDIPYQLPFVRPVNLRSLIQVWTYASKSRYIDNRRPASILPKSRNYIDWPEPSRFAHEMYWISAEEHYDMVYQTASRRKEDTDHSCQDNNRYEMGTVCYALHEFLVSIASDLIEHYGQDKRNRKTYKQLQKAQ